MQWKLDSLYRPASKEGAIQEDAICINKAACIAAVCDGVSGPYSPSNPGKRYGELSGGQMVVKTIQRGIEAATADSCLTDVLITANNAVLQEHSFLNLSPNNHTVAGASLAASHFDHGVADIIVIGDCFVFWRDEKNVHALTNFDQFADDFEKQGEQFFQACLDDIDKEFPETKGKNVGKAWDKYYQYFSEKQYYRANRNIGRGGHAVLNGDSYLRSCWSRMPIFLEGVRWVMLCTDGLLPRHLATPRQQNVLASEIAKVYEKDGLLAIPVWRDKLTKEHEAETKTSSTPHVEGYPEGSIISWQQQ